MKAKTRPDSEAEELTPEELAAVKAAAGWVNQLSRTLKTCRLYEASNPTVIRFRQELGAALESLLNEHGALTFRFTADDVLCHETSLYAAKSRDDNIALPFFRDGIRSLNLSPGIQQSELDILVDALLAVTGRNQETDDLVTLLWQAHLPNLTVDYVPGEADVRAGGGIDVGGWGAGTRSSHDEPGGGGGGGGGGTGGGGGGSGSGSGGGGGGGTGGGGGSGGGGGGGGGYGGGDGGDEGSAIPWPGSGRFSRQGGEGAASEGGVIPGPGGHPEDGSYSADSRNYEPRAGSNAAGAPSSGAGSQRQSLGSGFGAASGGSNWQGGGSFPLDDESTQSASKATASDFEEAPRSDDWSFGQLTAEIEANFDEIESSSAAAVARFQAEFDAESEVPLVTGAIAVTHALLTAGLKPEQILDISRFIPHILQPALEQGTWREAGEAVALLEGHPNPDWSAESFVQELCQPAHIATLTHLLESQESEQVGDFIGFARHLGEHATDLLAHLLSEVQNTGHQQQLSDAIVEQCRSNPELLAPWLSDDRGDVVHNTVRILGAIGGKQAGSLLSKLVDHADLRIRQELVTALGNVDLQHARPMLVRLLQNADSQIFCAVLGQLAQQRDPVTARLVVGYLTDSGFSQRPIEERRAIYTALATTGGDEVLPQLEDELHKGGWFSRSSETDRQEVAMCIARIGTPVAKLVLERGAESRRGPVRKACEEALESFEDHE